MWSHAKFFPVPFVLAVVVSLRQPTRVHVLPPPSSLAARHPREAWRFSTTPTRRAAISDAPPHVIFVRCAPKGASFCLQANVQ
jgi:hypothetical protein